MGDGYLYSSDNSFFFNVVFSSSLKPPQSGNDDDKRLVPKRGPIGSGCSQLSSGVVWPIRGGLRLAGAYVDSLRARHPPVFVG